MLKNKGIKLRLAPNPGPGVDLVRCVSRILHCFKQLIDGFDFSVVRFQLFVFFERGESAGEVAEPVIDQCQVEIDERESRLDVSSSFVMKPRQPEFTGIIVKISQVVMSFDVSGLVF